MYSWVAKAYRSTCPGRTEIPGEKLCKPFGLTGHNRLSRDIIVSKFIEKQCGATNTSQSTDAAVSASLSAEPGPKIDHDSNIKKLQAMARNMSIKEDIVYECQMCGAHRPLGFKCCGSYLGINDEKPVKRRNIHQHSDADEDEVENFLLSTIEKLNHGKTDCKEPLACIRNNDYEQALVTYRTLNAALKAKDEDAAEALLDGGHDPNLVDWCFERNALHMAAWKGCRLPLFHRILGMIHNVNACDDDYGNTALINAAYNNHLDIVVSLMNHPGIDLNVRNRINFTALHYAVQNNHPAILAQLVSDDRVDTSLKAKYFDINYTNKRGTPLSIAIDHGYDECVKILREHGAPEE